jgi:hypothetical protein
MDSLILTLLIASSQIYIGNGDRSTDCGRFSMTGDFQGTVSHRNKSSYFDEFMTVRTYISRS